MDASSAELLFEPQQRRWFLTVDNTARSVDSERDVIVMASYMVVKISDPSARPPVRGKVRLVREAGQGYGLQMLNLLGQPEGEPTLLVPADVSTATAEWRYGLNPDRWLDCEAELVVSEARRIGLQLFLPARVGMEDKTVSIMIGENVVTEALVLRGSVTKHWIELPEGVAETFTVRIQSSYAEPVSSSRDVRSLGVVLVQLSLDQTIWKDAFSA